MKPIIWSYGGGKQTAAIAVLVAQGRLPRPERIVMADTGRECATTFEYLRDHIAPMLETVGCQVEVLRPHQSRHDLFYVYKDERKAVLPLIPLWTKKDGEDAQLLNMCSGTWKRDVVISWLKHDEQGYGPKNPVRQWIGFSRDEVSRCKPSPRRWITNEWPLFMGYGIDLNRAECVELVLNAGLPEPPKSRCWMCPYQTNDEWRDVQTRPDEWQNALDLDILFRDRDEHNAVYLHRSRKPLEEANLADNPEKPRPLFDYAQMECAEGCWV